MSNEQTIIAGRVSGYVNTEIEVKTASTGTKHLSILLGGQKDTRGQQLPSMKVTFFNKDAELFAATISKGDLIVITKMALNPVVVEGKSYANNFQLIGKDFFKIERRSNDNQEPRQQAPQQAQRPQPAAQQPQPQPAGDFDSFDDDIPF